MTCDHNCNQGRDCHCQADTQPPSELAKANKEDAFLLAAVTVMLIGFIVWSLV